jgi:hypothetical protein
MGGKRGAESVDGDIATAFGIFALTTASLHEAAEQSGVTRWELEDAIADAGLSETFEIEQDGDVSETIDDLLDGS